MDKQQARKIITQTFESPFDKGRFTDFIKNLLNRIDEAPFTYQGNYIPDTYKQYIRKLERIGKFSDGEKSLDILVITLQKETSLERARTMQRNFIAWYLNGSRGGTMKDAALAAYVSPDQTDWRFSLVKMDYTFEKGKSGKMKVKEAFTPARRWSFLMGANEKSHTAQSRLVKILADDEHDPTLAELEEAFNIETVTREFFLKYRELFIRTKEALDKVVKIDPKVNADFKAKGVDTVNFAKKLLGQIVFLYFLQKKGWFGVGRDDDWGTGSKHFLRQLFVGTHGSYQNFFNDILEPLFYEALRIDRSHDDDYYSRFNCKIPFLNGGLFDPIGNYDWVHTDIHLPNDLFSNSRKTEEGDIGDGILDVFDRYNFTVREDEPLEKEVAIDPELLGKAYEKFNAIRPDNFDEFTKALKSGKKGEENKFNKKFGVYYTPREIVHYMCKQSLINYLYTQAEGAGLSGAIKKQDIEDLIEVGGLITEHEATALIKQEKIKNGIQKSTEYTALLSDSIRENATAIDRWLEEITVCDPAVGSGAFPVGMMNEIVRARNVLSVFLNDRKRSDYEFKRRCIEHSLYGVDIDPGAVEIAKLRLWLSLVVDEDDIKNIKPLPNLDYKIVCGNSLLGVEKDLFNYQLFDDLEKLKPLFFNETNPTQKQEYKKQIDGLISQITNGHKEFDFEVYFSEVFHQKGGFDVVISNPPYGAKVDNKTKDFVNNTYQYISGNANSAILFIEKGLQIICPGATMCYIIPKSFIYSNSWETARQVLNDDLQYLIDIGKGFENVLLEQVIFVAKKSNKSSLVVTGRIIDRGVIINETAIDKSVYDLFEIFIAGISHEIIELGKKIKQNNPSFASVCTIKRGLDIQDSLTEEIWDEDVIRCKSIGKYFLKPANEGLTKEKLKELYDDIEYMKRRKIIIQNIVAHVVNPSEHIILMATIDRKGIIGLGSVGNIFITKEYISDEYITALLNSKLISWYAYRFVYGNAIRTMRFDYYHLRRLPLIEVNQELLSAIQKPFIDIVNKILAITKDDDYLKNPAKQARVKEYEKQIDQMVYELYGLTEKEIRIVEGEGK